MGYIYLIEAQGDIGGDDFIVDHAGDPEDIVIGNYTEDTYYCKLQVPKQYTKGFSTGAKVITGAAGNQYSERSSMRSYTLLADGIETSAANADVVESFCMLDAHTTGIEATFREYHLIIKKDTDTYVTFTDSAGNRQKYCTGIVTGGLIIWTKEKPLRPTVKLYFESVW